MPTHLIAPFVSPVVVSVIRLEICRRASLADLASLESSMAGRMTATDSSDAGTASIGDLHISAATFSPTY